MPPKPTRTTSAAAVIVALITLPGRRTALGAECERLADSQPGSKRAWTSSKITRDDLFGEVWVWIECTPARDHYAWLRQIRCEGRPFGEQRVAVQISSNNNIEWSARGNNDHWTETQSHGARKLPIK